MHFHATFLLYNLVYNIKLFTFAAQTGNATRCPTLLQEERRGESEQKIFKNPQNKNNNGRKQQYDCRAQSGNHSRVD